MQAALGFVPKDAVPLIARELNLSIAEVHGVVTSIIIFAEAPRPPRRPSYAAPKPVRRSAAVALEAHAKARLGIDYHGTTADGAISLEPVYCLGNCALGPSMMIDQQLHGRVTAERFDALMAQSRETRMSAHGRR